MAAGRKQVHQQHMDAHVQGGQDLVGELLDVPGAILVRRRHDLHQGHQAMAADVANGQRAAASQGGRFDGMLAACPGRRLGHSQPARVRGRRQGQRLAGSRAGVQRQHVGNGLSRVLLGHGIVPLRQQTAVESCPDCRDPADMEIVKDARINAGPIVYGHGGFSCQECPDLLYHRSPNRPSAGPDAATPRPTADSPMKHRAAAAYDDELAPGFGQRRHDFFGEVQHVSRPPSQTTATAHGAAAVRWGQLELLRDLRPVHVPLMTEVEQAQVRLGGLQRGDGCGFHAGILPRMARPVNAFRT